MEFNSVFIGGLIGVAPNLVVWIVVAILAAIAAVVITGLLLIYPAVQSPGLFGASAGKDEVLQPIPVKEMLPVLREKVPDDIMPAPGWGRPIGQIFISKAWRTPGRQEILLRSLSAAASRQTRFISGTVTI